MGLHQTVTTINLKRIKTQSFKELRGFFSPVFDYLDENKIKYYATPITDVHTDVNTPLNKIDLRKPWIGYHIFFENINDLTEFKTVWWG